MAHPQQTLFDLDGALYLHVLACCDVLEGLGFELSVSLISGSTASRSLA
jgi:hypothetical protein